MFTDKMETIKMFGVAAIALLMMCSGVFILAGGEYDAETVNIDGQDYTYAEVSVAPGYKWQYTVEFPSDLEADTELSVYTTGTSGFISGQLSSFGTADRTINLSFDGATSGQTYTLVLKAVHTPSSQTTYQAIKFTVVDGMSITPKSGALGTNFVVGDNGSDAYTYTIQTAIGKIVEGSISVKIDGSVATFTPTKVSDTEYTVKVTANTATAGKKTVVVTASNDLSEEASSTTTYIVYDKIVAEDVTIRAYSDGKTVWSLASEQTNSSEDAKVEVLASYMHIDKPELENYRSNGDSTLTRTGAPSAPISMQYVIYVVTTNMVGVENQQDAYANLYVYDEPDFTLSADVTKVTTYTKMTPVDVTFSASTDTLAKTWNISPAGLTLAGDGETRTVTVDKDTPVGTYTVTVTTPSGQEETATLTIDHENDFTISGSTTLNPVLTGSIDNGVKRTYNYTISPEDFPSDVTWSIKSNSDAGVVAIIDGGVLSLQCASPLKNVTIVLHAETECGNYADLSVTVNFYNVLAFNEVPTTGAYAYATNE